MFETPEDKTSQNLPVLAQNSTGLIQHSPGVLGARESINPGYVPSENKISSEFYPTGWAPKDRMV